MGSTSKGYMQVLVAMLTLVVSGVVVFGAAQMGVFSGVPVLSSLGQADTPTDTDGDAQPGGDTSTEFRMVQWTDEYTVPLEMKAPVAANLQADIFVDTPDTDGDYGDYVDYNRTKATSGMTQGVDFFHQDGANVQSLTFDPGTSIQPGTYDVAVEDNASSGSKTYHDLFTEATVPETVEFNRYDDGKATTIVEQGDFDRRAAYDSDSYTLYSGTDTNSDVPFSDLDGTTDMKPSAYGTDDDETFTVTRTLDYKHGVDYLGDVDVLTVNSTSNVDADMSVTAMVRNEDGELEETEIFNQDVADGGEENNFEEQIQTIGGEDTSETDPAIVGDELNVQVTVEFDGGSAVDGDTQFNATINDIYGNTVGTSPYISLTS